MISSAHEKSNYDATKELLRNGLRSWKSYFVSFMESEKITKISFMGHSHSHWCGPIKNGKRINREFKVVDKQAMSEEFWNINIVSKIKGKNQPKPVFFLRCSFAEIKIFFAENWGSRLLIKTFAEENFPRWSFAIKIIQLFVHEQVGGLGLVNFGNSCSASYVVYHHFK